MIRYMIDLDDLGYDTSWLLAQQVLGMPDPKMQSDFLINKVALLLFFRSSLPERLCITAAVRQMSGTTIFQANPGEGWGHEVQHFQELLMPIFAYYLDINYCYGLSLAQLRAAVKNLQLPLINAGGPDAHPAHVLADVACLLRYSSKERPSLEGQKTAWIGAPNGTLYSLIQAAAWFKFSLLVAAPENVDVNDLVKKAASTGADVRFTRNPEEAVKGANFIYAGYRGEISPKDEKKWAITPGLMKMAADKARLLLCASPVRAIDISEEVLKSKAQILTRQAEYRLRVHKRLLHWIFQS